VKRVALLVALAIAGAACSNSAAPKVITAAAPKPPTWVCNVTTPAGRFVESLFISRGDLKTANRDLDALFGFLPDPGGNPHGSSERHFTVDCRIIHP
jgi:hypothetical protein